MGFLIGIDVGSQSVKALLVDEDGRARALQASAPCAMSHPASGWAEQDPADWETALSAAVRDASCRPASPTPMRRCSGSPARSTA